MIKRKPMTEETKRKIGNSNRGKKRTKEQKNLISLKTKEAMKNVTIWNKGKKWSDEEKIEERNRQKIIHELNPEIRKKQSILAKERWENHEYRKNITEGIKKGRCGIPSWNKGKVGNESHAWKGGVSAEPYCEQWIDIDYKESIRERDNHECKNPDCWKTSNRICIHHIDYNKKNCHPNNLIALCNSCNCRANWNREYWEIFYKGVLEMSKEKTNKPGTRTGRSGGGNKPKPFPKPPTPKPKGKPK